MSQGVNGTRDRAPKFDKSDLGRDPNRDTSRLGEAPNADLGVGEPGAPPNAKDRVWGPKLVRFEGDESKTVAQVPSAEIELKHFQNVTNSVVQDALSVWADLWAELEHDAVCGVAVSPEDENGLGTGPGPHTQKSACGSPPQSRNGAIGSPSPIAKERDREPFQPSCGWPEFLEKMWVLRQNLDFLARFSRPKS